MGEVVSFAKARQSDIFSMFDAACPSLPEETSKDVIEMAEQSVGGSVVPRPARFRTACALIALISVLGVALSFFGRSADQRQLSGDLGFSGDLVVTDEFTLEPVQSDFPAWRQSRETWLAHIAKLENNPAYQQIMREKRLFSITHPDRQEQ